MSNSNPRPIYSTYMTVGISNTRINGPSDYRYITHGLVCLAYTGIAVSRLWNRFWKRFRVARGAACEHASNNLAGAVIGHDSGVQGGDINCCFRRLCAYV